MEEIKCYSCGNVRTERLLIQEIRGKDICILCAFIIAGINYDEELCQVITVPNDLTKLIDELKSAMVEGLPDDKERSLFERICEYKPSESNSKTALQLLSKNKRQIKSVQNRSDCVVSVTFMPREKRYTNFVLGNRPIEVN